MSTPSFTTLTPSISLHTPSPHTSGHLIILCTWLGARTQHISKYISAYTSIAPAAKILLIQSSLRSITSPYATQRRVIQPAASVVRAVLNETKSPKIMLHTFSNGGPNAATQLLLVLREQRNEALPLVGVICDSGPAAGEYWRNYNAMVLSLPAGVARVLGAVVVHGILILLAASVWMGRYEKLEVLIRRTLLSKEFVMCGRICYVYSKEDRMTWWEDVVGHAGMARGMGWEVDEWCVEGTAHCNHLSKDVEGYVDRMRGMWEGSK
ncbi:indole-diterpene biosynthesis protein-like protein PaxU [Ophiobolus disseminans]|uniref:Indole-diterpene biosynthesis protein-like protein PaxU n=1 Tax=Ophiobolus disseminans TaxID=1469910 RepID=A0A6A7A9I7_9PLEO|nr:indole-diterpene biosynthesis protein-like protein PaxU [Ophiobolus disseminans]